MKMYTKVENRDWEDVSIGSSLAHSGKTLTDEHKKKIAQSLLERGSGKKYVIQAKNAIDGRIVIFENGQDAAEKLQCSRQTHITMSKKGSQEQPPTLCKGLDIDKDFH